MSKINWEAGQMVKMVGNDDMIVQGALGTMTCVSAGNISVCWSSMEAFKPDHRYRNEFKAILTTDVCPNSIEVVDYYFTLWTVEPGREYYIDDCVKYVGKNTKQYRYGDLFCVYNIDYSKHILNCIKLSNYNLYTLNISDCTLESRHYAFELSTKVTAIKDSAYTKVGTTGCIYMTDYRTALPYLVRWDDGGGAWVAACTIAKTVSDIGKVIAEESTTKTPIDSVLENGFSREVIFYEKD